MSLESTVGIAKVGTKSLRATVPEGVVAYLGLTAGDKLDWVMEFANGRKVVIVTKTGSFRSPERPPAVEEGRPSTVSTLDTLKRAEEARNARRRTA